MEVTNIHKEIEKLKYKIVMSETTTKDIDVMNMIEAYIKELEENQIITETELNESYEEMIPRNVVIHKATIFIGGSPQGFSE